MSSAVDVGLVAVDHTPPGQLISDSEYRVPTIDPQHIRSALDCMTSSRALVASQAVSYAVYSRNRSLNGSELYMQSAARLYWFPTVCRLAPLADLVFYCIVQCYNIIHVCRPCQSSVKDYTKKADGFLHFNETAADSQLNVIRPKLSVSCKHDGLIVRPSKPRFWVKRAFASA